MTRYEDRSKDELLQLAAEHNIEGRSSMSKDELVSALRGNPPAPAAGPAGAAKHVDGKIDVTGIFDVDAGTVAYIYDQGSAKDQKDAAQGQIDRLLAHVGEGPGHQRDLRIVKIEE